MHLYIISYTVEHYAAYDSADTKLPLAVRAVEAV